MKEIFKKNYHTIQKSSIQGNSLILGWVLQAPFQGSGGYTSIFRFISLLRQLGHQSTVYIDPIAHLSKKKPDEIRRYVVQHFNADAQIQIGHNKIAKHDVLFATAWSTVGVVAKAKGSFRKIYFVQDFEPDFYEMNDPCRRFSEATYQMGLYPLTLGPHLSIFLKERYGVQGSYVDFGVDCKIYYPPSLRQNHSVKKIIFYARPETKRRGFEIAIAGFEKVYKNYEMEILFFGSEQLTQYKVPFPYVNLGILTPNKLAEIFREADIGISISLTNLSLIPLEMMACGCATIEIDSPRCEGTLVQRENALLVEPSPEGIAAALSQLLDQDELRQKISANGIAFSRGRNWESSAKQMETILWAVIASNRWDK